MKIGKIGIAFAALAAILAVLGSCGAAEKFADAKKLLSDAIAANEDFVRTMEDAADADAVAAAIANFGTSMKTLGRQIESLDEKYPELGAETPAELKELEAKFEATSKEAFESLMTKASAFADNAKVTAALQALEGIE